eukprot:SAG11_NODE_778_length_7212_cov_4.265392_1_plen_282_part_00
MASESQPLLSTIKPGMPTKRNLLFAVGFSSFLAMAGISALVARGSVGSVQHQAAELNATRQMPNATTEPVSAATPVPVPVPVEPIQAAQQAPARIAHCIVGEPRTLNFEEVYQNYQQHAISPLGGSSDVFLVLEDVGDANSTMNIHGTEVKTTNREVYDKAIKFLNPKMVRWVDSTSFPTPAGAPESPCASQYLKWHVCHGLISSVEKDENFTYTHVIKSRPDLVILRDLPAASELPQEVLIIPYYEVRDPHRHPCLAPVHYCTAPALERQCWQRLTSFSP